jgi:hypothetical protein
MRKQGGRQLDTTKKVYIAGPMTGVEEFNKKAFYDAAAMIASYGLTPVHTADMPLGLTYDEYIEESLNRIVGCDVIYLLKGYEGSVGVMEYELPYAKKNGMEIVIQGGAEEDALFGLLN